MTITMAAPRDFAAAYLSDGTVKVAATNIESGEKAVQMIRDIVAEPEIGTIYSGKVVKVLDFSNQDYVERDLMLMKVSSADEKRSKIRELVEIFRGRIVDVSAGHLMIEISGQENKIEAFIELMRPFGILEMVRTGRIAMLRSDAV